MNLKQLLPKPETIVTKVQNDSYQSPKRLLPKFESLYTLPPGWHISTSQLVSAMHLPAAKQLTLSPLQRLCQICHFFSPNFSLTYPLCHDCPIDLVSMARMPYPPNIKPNLKICKQMLCTYTITCFISTFQLK